MINLFPHLMRERKKAGGILFRYRRLFCDPASSEKTIYSLLINH